MPQLGLQMAFSINYGWEIITILEYFMQRFLHSTETFVVLKFLVESQYISLMSHKEFQIEIQNNRMPVERLMAKLLEIQSR